MMRVKLINWIRFFNLYPKLYIPSTYYKHLKKGAQQSHGLVSGRLACTSSKTEICIKQNSNLDFNPEFSS